MEFNAVGLCQRVAIVIVIIALYSTLHIGHCVALMMALLSRHCVGFFGAAPSLPIANPPKLHISAFIAILGLQLLR